MKSQGLPRATPICRDPHLSPTSGEPRVAERSSQLPTPPDETKILIVRKPMAKPYPYSKVVKALGRVRRMTSVMRRIQQINQPPGGYINPRTLQTSQLGDGSIQRLDFRQENVPPATVSMAVDYLSRLANGTAPEDAFAISVRGHCFCTRRM